MKKLITISFLFAASAANAGLFDSLATSDFPVIKSEKYKVDVYGYDTRIYEFVPKNAPDHVCIAAFSGGNTNAFQMECVKVK